MKRAAVEQVVLVDEPEDEGWFGADWGGRENGRMPMTGRR